MGLEYAIRFTWDGFLVDEADVAHFSVNETEEMDAVEIKIRAPFYDDPPPPDGVAGMKVLQGA